MHEHFEAPKISIAYLLETLHSLLYPRLCNIHAIASSSMTTVFHQYDVLVPALPQHKTHFQSLKFHTFFTTYFHGKWRNRWNDCLIDMKSTISSSFVCICDEAGAGARTRLHVIVRTLFVRCVIAAEHLLWAKRSRSVESFALHCLRWWLWIDAHNQQTILQKHLHIIYIVASAISSQIFGMYAN